MLDAGVYDRAPQNGRIIRMDIYPGPALGAAGDARRCGVAVLPVARGLATANAIFTSHAYSMLDAE